MPKTTPNRVRIGEFELNLDTGELVGNSETVRLGEKPFRILTTLIEHTGQLVTREDLQRRLWPNDTIVDFEHGINTAIKLLRKTLGDSADAPRYIETIPRRGYRLMTPIEPANSAAVGMASDSLIDKPSDLRASAGDMAGKVVSHYRVLDLIGGGGMGVVYRAEDLNLGRTVAMKFLSEKLDRNPVALERFHREAQAVSILDHPNICPIYEFGEHNRQLFLVMPLLKGRILRDRLAESPAKGAPLPVEELLAIALDVCAGLQEAHQKGIIHRDIKPANIFLTTNGQAKILDFGLAKTLHIPEELHQAGAPSSVLIAGNGSDLTTAEVCLGTLPYMSPEQVERRQLDERTDLFSFGIVLCEMATGSLACGGADPTGIFKAISEGKPVQLTKANPPLPGELERIINKALEKDPARRYQTASEMRSDLLNLKRDSAREYSGRTAGDSDRDRPSNRSLPLVSAILVFLVVVLLPAGYFVLRGRHKLKPSSSSWIQLTKFSDSATQPNLSPDGRMIVFIRGPETFITPGQIYVKMLPDGQPIQLTHDDLPKMAPVFNPDGSSVAYTATDRGFNWDTWVVPVPGGEPQRLLPDAAALSWLDRQRVLFSEIQPPSNKMAAVTAGQSRDEERNVYVPVEWGMAHRSWASPDHKWVLISEMDSRGWMPCRIVPFDGSSRGQTVGPNPARCTYAGWSPDGKTMYFTANAGDGFHIWRQRFPSGSPEQLTFGPTEEEGIAIAKDGRSLVTSAGIKESSVWYHDARGDRQVSGEGFATVPGLGYGSECARSVFSHDGKKLFYLVRKQGSRAFTSGELWSADLDSGRSEVVLPGISIEDCFDIGPDGKSVAYQSADTNGANHVWLASLDRRSPPQLVTQSSATSPGFGPGGRIYFRTRDGDHWSLFGVSSGAFDVSVSPGGNWWLDGPAPVRAHPVNKGRPILICNFCSAGWGSDRKFLYLRFRGTGEMGGGKALVIALPRGKELPTFPPGGLKSLEDAKRLNVVKEIDMSDKALLAAGPGPNVYAYTRVTIQRNLYRIPLD